MRILWLLPDLGFTSASRQACLVVPELARAGHDVQLAVLRTGGGFDLSLRARGVEVIELSTPHDLPIKAVISLDKFLRDRQFDVLHTWRAQALRAIVPVRLGKARVIASQPRRGAPFGWIDRLVARRVSRFAPEIEDANAVPLAVAATEAPAKIEVPDGAQIIACMGRLDGEHGIRDAIWAYQVLEFFMPNLHMAIIGDGPERNRLRQFAGSSPRVSFLGNRVDGAAYLSRATMVWIPSRKPGGEQVALEAQAAGAPVVATRLPSLSAVIVENETGLLVDPSDPVGLAKTSRKFLDNEGERRRIAANCTALMARWPSPAQVAAQWLEFYASREGARI